MAAAISFPLNPNPAPDLTGQRFGRLVVLERAQNEPNGSSRWRCLCDCGRVAVRNGSSMRKAHKSGASCMCKVCRQAIFVSFVRKCLGESRLLRLYERTGSIWSELDIKRLAESVRQGLENAGHHGPREEFDAIIVPVDASEAGSPGGQRAAYLYPIDGHGEDEWRCVECRKTFGRGFGCVACIEPVCRSCVENEAHGCPAGNADGESLAVVGASLVQIGRQNSNPRAGQMGMSRERARQIELVALRKMRTNWERLEREVLR